MSLKIIFVIRSWDHIGHQESTIRELCEAGHSVKVLFDEKWCNRTTTDEAVRALDERLEQFSWEFLIPRMDLLWLPIFGIRELRNYVRYLRYPEQSPFYLQRVEKKFPNIIQFVLRRKGVQKFLSSDFFWRFLDLFEKSVPVHKKAIQWLKDYDPDVLVATPANLWWSQEVDYIKAAKYLRIPTIIAVYSWDNVSTKGVFHEIPDLTVGWNSSHFREALKLGVPAEKMIVAGAPIFDKWMKNDLIPSDRSSFCQNVGLDSKRPFILYLGSSQNIAKDESWFVESLAVHLENSSNKELQELQILVRPHPANATGLSKLAIPRVVVWPSSGSLPNSKISLQDFYDSLYHSVGTLGINTSGMLDALVFGKSGMTILVDRYAITQANAIHYQDLFNTQALEVATAMDETLEIVTRFMVGRDNKKVLRQKFVKDFIRPRGENTPAGYVLARIVEMMASGQSPETIDKSLEQSNSV